MKIVADNLRITKNKIQEALLNCDAEPVKEIVRKSLKPSVSAIDINTGPLKKFPVKDMQFFIEAVQSVTDLPVFIDTSNPEAMEAGLKSSRNRTIINGFSLEPEKIEKILPLAGEYDADIVGFLLSPDSMVPADADSRLEAAIQLFEQVQAAGISPEKLIIDPVVPPLVWDDGIVQARAVLEVIRMLPEVLGFPVKTIAGLSNLTTGLNDRYRKTRIEQAYIPMLAYAGLDYLMMDVFNPETLDTALISGTIKQETIFSWEMIPGVSDR